MKLDFSIPQGEGPWPRRWAACSLALIALFHFYESPVALAFDPNPENCLPDLHLALLVRQTPQHLQHGEYVYWRPAGPTAQVKREFLLKQVVGVGGDVLRIKDQQIVINGVLVASGLPLLDPRRTDPRAFEREETIPSGFVFVLGTHPQSFDSRYWGYLDVNQIVGKAYKVL